MTDMRPFPATASACGLDGSSNCGGALKSSQQRLSRAQCNRRRRDARHRRRGFQAGLLATPPVPPPHALSLRPPPGLLPCAAHSSDVPEPGMDGPDSDLEEDHAMQKALQEFEAFMATASVSFRASSCPYSEPARVASRGKWESGHCIQLGAKNILQEEMSMSQFYDTARRVRARLPHLSEPQKPLLCIADQGAVVGLDVLVWTTGTTGVAKRDERLEGMLSLQCAGCNTAVQSCELGQDMGECEDCGVLLKRILWCDKCRDYTCLHCWELRQDEMRKQICSSQKRQRQSPSGSLRERQRRSPSGSGSGGSGHRAAAICKYT